jgi:hypothetical protein
MATDAGSSGDAGRARRLEHDAFGRIVVAENTVVITALPDTHATDDGGRRGRIGRGTLP